MRVGWHGPITFLLSPIALWAAWDSQQLSLKDQQFFLSTETQKLWSRTNASPICTPEWGKADSLPPGNPCRGLVCSPSGMLFEYCHALRATQSGTWSIRSMVLMMPVLMALQAVFPYVTEQYENSLAHNMFDGSTSTLSQQKTVLPKPPHLYGTLIMSIFVSVLKLVE